LLWGKRFFKEEIQTGKRFCLDAQIFTRLLLKGKKWIDIE